MWDVKPTQVFVIVKDSGMEGFCAYPILLYLHHACFGWATLDVFSFDCSIFLIIFLLVLVIFLTSTLSSLCRLRIGIFVMCWPQARCHPQ